MKFPVAVRWSASPRTSLAYALAQRIAASATRPIVDPSLAESLDAILQAPPLADLFARSSSPNSPVATASHELLDLAAALGAEDDDGPPALLDRASSSWDSAIRASASSSADSADVAARGNRSSVIAALSDAQTLFAERPGWRSTDLRLRIGPLREQWEARGPGLLRQVVLRALKHGWREREDGSADEPQRVIVVAPVTGGGGWACPARNVVVFEGLLANPWRQLPEIARLAWLLAQNLLTPPQDASPLATQSDARTALVDLVLAAGEFVELNQDDDATRQLARSTWL